MQMIDMNPRMFSVLVKEWGVEENLFFFFNNPA